MLWIFIGFLGVVAVIHELAHAFFMVRNGVEIKTIALGFPPLVLKKQVTIKRIQKKPITLGFGLLLLGAYVNPTKEGQMNFDSLPLDKKLLICGVGIVTHCMLIPFLLLIPYFFEPTWHINAVGLGIVVTSGILPLLFFVRPIPAGIAIVTVGSMFLVVIVWSIAAVGLDNIAIGSVGLWELTRETSTLTKMFTLFLSVSLLLGVSNAMPMMPLDGGHMVFAFLERFIDRKKARPIKVVSTITGRILLISFFFLVLTNLLF
jgi:membrane-associated protease RseP (regulator of RpoE activity)